MYIFILLRRRNFIPNQKCIREKKRGNNKGQDMQENWEKNRPSAPHLNLLIIIIINKHFYVHSVDLQCRSANVIVTTHANESEARDSH